MLLAPVVGLGSPSGFECDPSQDLLHGRSVVGWELNSRRGYTEFVPLTTEYIEGGKGGGGQKGQVCFTAIRSNCACHHGLHCIQFGATAQADINGSEKGQGLDNSLHCTRSAVARWAPCKHSKRPTPCVPFRSASLGSAARGVHSGHRIGKAVPFPSQTSKTARRPPRGFVSLLPHPPNGAHVHSRVRALTWGSPPNGQWNLPPHWLCSVVGQGAKSGWGCGWKGAWQTGLHQTCTPQKI